MTQFGPEEPLGGQTVTVYLRERGQHRQYVDTGETVVWVGCLVRSLGDDGDTVADGRGRDVQRWRVTAPAGSRAPTTAQATVEPGPADEDGQPLRLSFAGGAHAHYDLDGAEDHVTAVLTTST